MRDSTKSIAKRPPAAGEALPSIPFRSLVADFRAALWCAAQPADIDDATLMRRFQQMHTSFIHAIGRRRPGVLGGVDRALLIDIVRRWIRMYARGVDEIRNRYPRGEDTVDLVALDCNWSDALAIDSEGLMRLDIVSRYAEYWAERSVTWATAATRGRGVLETYAERMEFIGSDYYLLAESLMYEGRMMLRDQADNGMPAFEMFGLFRGLARPDHLEQHCERRGWRVSAIDGEARRIMWERAREVVTAR